MALIAGTAYFKVNGVQYSLRGNMNISLGDRERESVMGMDGYHGHTEKPVAAFIECDITDKPEIDLNVLETLQNVTVTAELINGKTAVLRNALQIKKLSLTAADGTVQVRFEGPKGEWIR